MAYVISSAQHAAVADSCGGLDADTLDPEHGGVDYIRALAGPFPHIPLLPTSGVTLDELPALLAIPSVVAVGVSRQLWGAARGGSREGPPADDPDGAAEPDGGWAAVTERARQWVAVVAAVRGGGREGNAGGERMEATVA
ncbi:hypothetical protein MMPV_003647 [Pyropia vietnamensis]